MICPVQSRDLEINQMLGHSHCCWILITGSHSAKNREISGKITNDMVADDA